METKLSNERLGRLWGYDRGLAKFQDLVAHEVRDQAMPNVVRIERSEKLLVILWTLTFNMLIRFDAETFVYAQHLVGPNLMVGPIAFAVDADFSKNLALKGPI